MCDSDKWPFYNPFKSFFRQLQEYLPQNWGSEKCVDLRLFIKYPTEPLLKLLRSKDIRGWNNLYLCNSTFVLLTSKTALLNILKISSHQSTPLNPGRTADLLVLPLVERQGFSPLSPYSRSHFEYPSSIDRVQIKRSIILHTYAV